MDKINWYPGHMKKTRELISENLSLVSAVCEVLDARIPFSSRNPDIIKLTSNKKRIVVLNKIDLADPDKLQGAIDKLQNEADYVLCINGQTGEGVKKLISILKKIEDEQNEGKERKKNLRLMIVGIPNVGKSSLINRLVGSKVARTGDRPGVTTGKQWLKIEGDMMLLDTPGILWPNLENQDVAQNLAICGSIKDEIIDIETLSLRLIDKLRVLYPENLKNRYKLNDLSDETIEVLDDIARKRGFILSGNRIDYERCAKTLLDEFRSGKIGRITLE